MTWMMPPMNMISALVTVLFFMPLNTWTVLPGRIPITTCPPITFEQEALVRRVGRNWAVEARCRSGHGIRGPRLRARSHFV
jgi:hypothetical protein